MYTSCLLLALSGLTPSAQGSDSPSWSMDYFEAKKQGQSERKPLLVVVGAGKEGYNKLSRTGTLSKESNDLLAGKYVCVYVDVDTETGKKLAKQLEVGNLGIVISDASGRLMAFYHEGDLADAALNTYLRRYSDPTRTVVHTESNPGPEARTSYYPPVYQPQTRTSYYPPVYQPGYIPSFSGSSYCPTCR